MKSDSDGPAPAAPTVAVVMATFNRAELISESIDSILNQTRPPDEFIIVNDGSTDDTARVVRRYGSRIRYLEKPNGGKPAALNMVLPSVESTYTWIFDDDDVALPGALETHLKFLAANPSCDFSYGTNYEFSGRFSEAVLTQANLKSLPARCGSEYFLWLMESTLLPTLIQAMLIPTRCYRTVGGFDEGMLRCEDIDVLLRIARCFCAGYTGQPMFALRLHGGDRGPTLERHAYADRYRIFWQYRRKIFASVRESLALSEYLPDSSARRAGSRVLSAMETRRALLERALIMTTHGLFAEAVEDFEKYVSHLDPASAPGDEERRKILALAYVGDVEESPPAAYYRRFGELSRGRPGLFGIALRGLYWSTAREAGRHHLVSASRLLGFAAILAGAYAGIPAIRRKSLHGFG